MLRKQPIAQSVGQQSPATQRRQVGGTASAYGAPGGQSATQPQRQSSEYGAYQPQSATGPAAYAYGRARPLQPPSQGTAYQPQGAGIRAWQPSGDTAPTAPVVPQQVPGKRKFHGTSWTPPGALDGRPSENTTQAEWEDWKRRYDKDFAARTEEYRRRQLTPDQRAQESAVDELAAQYPGIPRDQLGDAARKLAGQRQQQQWRDFNERFYPELTPGYVPGRPSDATRQWTDAQNQMNAASGAPALSTGRRGGGGRAAMAPPVPPPPYAPPGQFDALPPAGFYQRSGASQPSYSLGAGPGNYAYAPPDQRPPPFAQSVRFMGQDMDPNQFYGQRDAFIHNINQNLGPFAMNPSAGRPQMDFGSMWSRAGDMVQAGWQNPLSGLAGR